MTKGTITIRKDSLWKYSTFILLAFVVIAGFVYFSGDDEESGGVINPVAPSQPSAPTQPSQVSVEGRDFKGAEDATVTMVEYSSFSCGFCNRVRDTLDQILQTYPGDVKIVYKHFDRGGTDSQTAQGTECAGEQGQFWEMHDMIFDKGADVKSHVEELGLDVGAFNECLDSGKYASLVQQDTTEAKANGIRGTPGFLINGKLVSGAQPFENFKQVIDAELA